MDSISRQEGMMRRPIIRYEPAELHTAVDSALDALRADQDLYTQGNSLVEVVLFGGSPIGCKITRAYLSEKCSRFAQWETEKQGGWVRTRPPCPVLSALSSRGSWPGLRPLRGVIETPTLRPDGTVLDRPGYDPATGYVYLPPIEFPQIPENHSREDACRALADLLDVVGGSPAAQAAGAAAVLTLLARGAIAGPVPAWVYDGPEDSHGDVFSAIVTGRPAQRLPFPTERGLARVLRAHAGAPLISFALRPGAEVGGSVLAAVLTATIAAFRVRGRTRIVDLPWNSVIVASGDSITLSPDVARRVLFIRSAELSGPRRSTRWANENRSRLVGAGLTLLRAFIVAGRPRILAARWGSFDAWCELIPNAIAWAGGADPLSCRPEFHQ